MLTKLLFKLAKTPLKRIFLKNSRVLSQAGQDFWVCGEVFNEKKGGFFSGYWSA